MTRRVTLWPVFLLFAMTSLAAGLERTSPLARQTATQTFTDRRLDDDLPELEPVAYEEKDDSMSTITATTTYGDCVKENRAEDYAKPKKVVTFGYREEQVFSKHEAATMVNDEKAIRAQMCIPADDLRCVDEPRALVLARRLMRTVEDLQGADALASQAQNIIWLLFDREDENAEKASEEFLSSLNAIFSEPGCWRTLLQLYPYTANVLFAKRHTLTTTARSLQSTLQTIVLVDTALRHLQKDLNCGELGFALKNLKDMIDEQSTTIGIDAAPLEEAARTALGIARHSDCVDEHTRNTVAHINRILDDLLLAVKRIPPLKQAIDLDALRPNSAHASMAHEQAVVQKAG